MNDLEDMLEEIASCHPEAAREFKRLQGIEAAAKGLIIASDQVQGIAGAFAALRESLEGKA